MMSTAASIMAEPPVAARAGADLKEARERLGLSLDDVACRLRIRLPHLESLEEGRISTLPGHAYALAFARTYATALGLDAEEMVRRFRTEAAEFNRRPPLVFPVPMPERGLPTGAIVLLGVMLTIGAYAGWYRLSGEGRLPAEAVTAIPERLAPLAEQALPPVLPANPVAPAPQIALADAAPAGMTAEPAPAAMSISPSSAAAAQLPPREAVVSAAGGLGPVALSVADVSHIVLHASADAWLLVKDRAGSVLLNRTMKTGETWTVPARTDLLLTTGNAGGTDILVDGAAVSSLGTAGSVRRDLPLDVDAIRDGKLATALAAPIAPERARQ